MAHANLNTKRAHIVLDIGAGVIEAAAAEVKGKGKATEAAEATAEVVTANKKRRMILKDRIRMKSNLRTLP